MPLKVIMLCYYPAYRNRAQAEAGSLLKALGHSPQHDLTIVCNNPEAMRAGDLPGPDPRSEFAGWKAGLDHVQGYQGPVLFLNDTFCHHHRWSALDRFRLIRRLHGTEAQHPYFMLGEVNRGEMALTFLDRPLPHWISTYCFYVGPTLAEGLSDILVLPEAAFTALVRGVHQGRILWGPDAAPALAEHLDSWLTPGPHDHWYRAGQVSDDALAAKLKSILNEFWLSARCLELGAALSPFRTLGDGFHLRLSGLRRRLRA